MHTEVELASTYGNPREDDGGVFAGLTEPQARAVRHTEGPLLVLAGPGSGKTRVITRRIAHLVQCGIPPWQILALTFTNKAAAEMRERVLHLLGEGGAARGLTVTTFHALCARLLRRWAEVANLPGLKPDFAIFDSADQLSLMKKTIEGLNLSTGNWPPRSVLSRISEAKNDLQDAETFAARHHDFAGRTVAKIYQAYQKALRTAGGVDFDDLLVLTARMLRENAAVREACRERWQYLLIDEYQDTNRAQFVIASLLAGEGQQGRPPNICVVGDPDQSIYGWRGADITNILDFEKAFPGAEVIALGENFRSTQKIINAADAMIRRNTRRKHKTLFTSNPPGEKIDAVSCRDEHHEAQIVLEWFRARRAEGLAWKDMAVFYRTNALSRVVEDELRNAGVPYVVARGTAYFQREEIKNAVAYLRVVANPADDVSLDRVINTPARGIGDTSLDKLRNVAAIRGVPLADVLRSLESNGAAALGVELTARAQNAIGKFIRTLDDWRDVAKPSPFMGAAAQGQYETGALAELVERVIRESGLEAMYKAGKTESDEERLANLAELVTSAREFEETFDPGADPVLTDPRSAAAGTYAAPTNVLTMLHAYLERVTLVADADSVDPAQGAVTLMTLHAAKGLEFGAVAMVGLEERVLPHARVAEMPDQLEEERRLCFVGITRAMQRLLVTDARYRSFRGVPERQIASRFLAELPADLVSHSDQSDEFGGDDNGHRSAWDKPSATIESTRRAHKAPQARIGGRALAEGVLVRHPQFGIGRVEAVTGGQGARARIRFRDVGVKTLVLEYARLELIDEG
ncbi:MAG: UvrD-helicase domain-containing protein [Phycisphaeraceae bacterium]|nr:UvrD-helicase domain-containing protein [Phycisphaeraceae bacterium]